MDPQMRSIIRRGLVAILLVARFAAAGEPSTPPDSCPYWGSNSFHSTSKEIDASIGVYRCVVKEFKKVPPPADAEKRYGETPEFGQANLEVLETFHGLAAKELTLPYARRDPNSLPFHRRPLAIGTSLWPEELFDQPRRTVCIFVGRPIANESYGDVPVNGKVATNFFVGETADADFSWMRDLCALKAARRDNQAVRLATLAQATTDGNEQIRRYAVESMMREFSAAEPELVTAALLRQFDRTAELKLDKTGEARGSLEALANVGDDWRLAQTVRRMAIRTLALCVARTKTPAAKGWAILYLASAASKDSFRTSTLSSNRYDNDWPLPFAASTVLVPAETADLRSVIESELKSEDLGPAALALKHWVESDAVGPR